MIDIPRRGTPIAAPDVQAGDWIEGISKYGIIMCGKVDRYGAQGWLLLQHTAMEARDLTDLTLVRRPLAVGQWWRRIVTGLSYEVVAITEAGEAVMQADKAWGTRRVRVADVEVNWTPLHTAPMPSLAEQAATADQRRLNRAVRAAGLEAPEPLSLQTASVAARNLGCPMCGSTAEAHFCPGPPPVDSYVASSEKAPEPPLLIETCPKCRHAWHQRECLNMASDNDCSCASSEEAPEPAEPECPFPMGAKVRRKTETWLHGHVSGMKYDERVGAWKVTYGDSLWAKPDDLELVPLPVHCESCGQVIP